VFFEKMKAEISQFGRHNKQVLGRNSKDALTSTSPPAKASQADDKWKKLLGEFGGNKTNLGQE
jgi:hypothetical protein